MGSLVNSIKYLGRNYTTSLQSIPENKSRDYLLTLSEVSIGQNQTKTLQEYKTADQYLS